MTFAEELQSVLGVGLHPLGITVHKGALNTPANDEYYLTYDPYEETVVWANNAPAIVQQEVQVRYFSKRTPLNSEHIEEVKRLLTGMGMRMDGTPEQTPMLSATDYAGEISEWSRTVAVNVEGN